MPPRPRISFDRLPFDGKLYRVQWGGAMRVDEVDPTAAVYLWLAEVEEKDGQIVGLKKSMVSDSKYAAKGKSGTEQTPKATLEGRWLPNVTWIDELAGSIPQLPIGSLWRDRVNVPGASFPGDEVANFTIDASTHWDIVSPNSVRPTGIYKQWEKVISPLDYDLSGVNAAGQLEYFSEAPLIRCKTEEGQILLLPQYEIFRRFYAPSSEMANAILSNHWALAVNQLMDIDRSGFRSNTEFRITSLNSTLSDVSCRFLALYWGSNAAQRRAAEIFETIENQRVEARRIEKGPKGKIWINALPPFFEEKMHLRVSGRKLPNSNAFLVFRILSANFPKLSFPIERFSTEVQGQTETKEVDDTNGKYRNPKQTVSVGTIAARGNAKNTQRILNIESPDVWNDLPVLKKTKLVTKIEATVRTLINYREGLKNPLMSAGNASENGEHHRASFNAAEDKTVIDRFIALRQCFETLAAEKRIVRTDFALGTTVIDTSFGKLHELPNLGKSNWPIVVDCCGLRPRLAWISKLLYEGRTLYWLEIESNKPKTALVFRMARGDLSLDIALVLLKLAAHREGVWPTHPIDQLKDKLTWHRVVHRFDAGSLNPSTMLNALDKLA